MSGRTCRGIKPGICVPNRSRESAPSLVKRIPYPKDHKFSCEEVRRRLKLEKDALVSCKTSAHKKYLNVQFKEVRLIVPRTALYFAATPATPDLFMEWDCCGRARLEVKSTARNTVVFRTETASLHHAMRTDLCLWYWLWRPRVREEQRIQGRE